MRLHEARIARRCPRWVSSADTLCNDKQEVRAASKAGQSKTRNGTTKAERQEILRRVRNARWNKNGNRASDEEANWQWAPELALLASTELGELPDPARMGALD